MCGITGIIYKNKQDVDLESVVAMTDKLKHRGPDGYGYFVEKNVGLGHRRLSIIDVSDAAAQPFYFGDELVLIFNGAIYNYIEIREQLVAQGYKFHTNSDTEVLLSAYHFWGEKCVDYFNGMWAFAIYDKRNNTVFCSRDRFGIKPFYYFQNEGKFVFASEIKAILEEEKIKKVNVQTVLQYLITNFTDYNDATFFKEINKLPGSHNMVYNLTDHTIRLYKYYDIQLNKEVSQLSIEDSLTLFEKEFQRSIELRLRSDVKIGTALSGGLDSGYVAAVAAHLLDDPKSFNAVTVGSLHPSNDESKLASVTASVLGLSHHIVTPDRKDFEEELQQVIYSMEEPFNGLSIYMQTFLMKEAKAEGVKVLLDGQGADEVLLGYPRYTTSFLKSHGFRDNFKFLAKLQGHYGISLLKGLKLYFYFSNFWARKLFLRYRGMGLKKRYKKIIDFSHIKKLNNSYSNIFELQKNELFWAQIPQLVRWADINSMSQGIESRLPFLDYKFVETCLSINNNFKLKDGWSKYILRKNLAKHLPDEVAWKGKKIGFEPPSEEWWPRSQKITDIINGSKIIKELFKKPIDHLEDRDFEWRLYNLAIWEKMYDMEI